MSSDGPDEKLNAVQEALLNHRAQLYLEDIIPYSDTVDFLTRTNPSLVPHFKRIVDGKAITNINTTQAEAKDPTFTKKPHPL